MASTASAYVHSNRSQLCLDGTHIATVFREELCRLYVVIALWPPRAVQLFLPLRQCHSSILGDQAPEWIDPVIHDC